jgi:exoribonuclease R
MVAIAAPPVAGGLIADVSDLANPQFALFGALRNYQFDRIRNLHPPNEGRFRAVRRIDTVFGIVLAPDAAAAQHFHQHLLLRRVRTLDAGADGECNEEQPGRKLAVMLPRP